MPYGLRELLHGAGVIAIREEPVALILREMGIA